MADTETILQGILDQKPLDTKTAFDTVIRDKIADDLESYKIAIANQMLGVEPEAETEEPAEDETETEYDFTDLTDEELETLSSMTDDELEAFLKDVTDEEDAEPKEQPEVGEEEQE